ncbi:MAG: 5-(carboxyamino)imidazole ribonucleotide synthase [Cyanobacteria bacterium P01_D01_bin.105]
MKKIGVIGGGQLAWMMATGAEALGLELYIQTPNAEDPACTIASQVFLGAVDDAAITAEMANSCDVITFENEFIDLDALRSLEKSGVVFYPQLDCLAPLLDKYDQREYCNTIGLPSLPFATLEDESDRDCLRHKIASVGLPLVLKTRRHGYDGQGTFVLDTLEAVEATWRTLGYQPVLLEAFIDFEKELAVMVARSHTGKVSVYPVVETVQIEQVCRRVIAPARVADDVVKTVREIATTLMNSLNVIGIFGIELFLTQEGTVLINEIAPRTHNSGHYTLDACVTSQFEQQLRAVSGHSLGSTALDASIASKAMTPDTIPSKAMTGAVMVNLLGTENSDSDYAEKREALAHIPNAYLYWYGKKPSKIGRKMGHVTVLTDDPDSSGTVEHIIERIERVWYQNL